MQQLFHLVPTQCSIYIIIYYHILSSMIIYYHIILCCRMSHILIFMSLPEARKAPLSPAWNYQRVATCSHLSLGWCPRETLWKRRPQTSNIYWHEKFSSDVVFRWSCKAKSKIWGERMRDSPQVQDLSPRFATSVLIIARVNPKTGFWGSQHQVFQRVADDGEVGWFLAFLQWQMADNGSSDAKW